MSEETPIRCTYCNREMQILHTGSIVFKGVEIKDTVHLVNCVYCGISAISVRSEEAIKKIKELVQG